MTEVRANIKSNAPRILERPGKIFIRGNYIFLNELDKGIHVIDNSNPAAPKRVSFIDIPGNIDIAVKGNTMYADCYADMVTLDIANPLQAILKNVKENAFPHRLYTNGFSPEPGKVIVEWIKKDTTVIADCNGGFFFSSCSSCSFIADASSVSMNSKNSTPYGAGVAGSMARFAIVNNYMYTVGIAELHTYDVSSAHNPQFLNKSTVGWNIETIFPFKENLFIGSMTGMFIYSIANPSTPTRVSQFNHARTCDPVIADDNYAYVTLRSGSACGGFTNQLDVLKIDQITNPQLLRSYELTNPHGLSKDGDLLFITDGKDGLKIFDAQNPNDLKLKKHIRMSEAFDVIAFNKVALVVSSDGMYQYDYSDANNIKLLSKIAYNK